jgi:hypothetical protein
MRATLKRVIEYREAAAFRAFLALVGSDLDDVRKKNDTAEGDEVFRNQGVAQYLNRLLKEMGFDPEKKHKGHDGAFS